MKAREKKNAIQIPSDSWHTGTKMKQFFLKTSKLCPVFSCLFSWTVIVVTIIISYEISPLFIYSSAQVYFNWFSINRISSASVTIAINNVDHAKSHNRSTISHSHTIQIREKHNPPRVDESTRNNKVWYCEKCAMYTSRPSRHCALCKKCFHYRDHHCFFIGNCILRQNMGNFIIICIYTSLSSIYSLTILGPYLLDHLDHVLGDKSSLLDVVLNFSFPVALARFLFSAQDSCIVLVTLFDALLSISCISFGFGVWKLYACLTGKQRYFPHVAKKYNIAEIFGRHGLWNLIFPFDAIFGAKSITEQYLCKEI